MLSKLIEQIAQEKRVHAQIVYTEAQGHAIELVQQHLPLRKWSAIVAIGGDGTMNEIGSTLVMGDVPMGIIPMGSGNGLARHLGIPLSATAALKRLFSGKPLRIDSALLNDRPFFCTAGIGFDAYVGSLFSVQKQRGLLTYMRVSFNSYWNYKPQQFVLNGESLEAFSITIANAGQYGNNAWIAPQANLQDGTLDICTIQPFPKWYGAVLANKLFAKTLQSSRYTSYQRVQNTRIDTDRPALVHYDGEPLQLDTNRIDIKIRPASISIIC